MMVDTFFNKYLKIGGYANRSQFLIVVALLVIGRTYACFYDSLSNIPFYINNFLFASSKDGIPMLSLMSLFSSDGYQFYNISRLPIGLFNDVVSFVTIYMLFVTTVKYCRTLKFSSKKSYITGLLLCLLFSLGYVYGFDSFISISAPTYLLYYIIYLLMILIPLAYAYYLYAQSNIQEPSNIEKPFIVCLVAGVLYILFSKLSFLNLFSENISEIFFLVAILVVLFITQITIKPLVSKTAPYLINGLLILFVIIGLGVGISVLSLYLEDNAFIIILLCLLNIFSCLYFFVLFCIAAVGAIADDTEIAEAENINIPIEPKIASDSPVFSNKIIDLLFSYRGQISSREYRAMLILIFLTTVVGLYPQFINSLISVFGNVFSFDYFLFTGRDVFSSFYSFVVFYCSFIISIKRCRTKGYNSVIGWLSGAFTCLFFNQLSLILQTVFIKSGYYNSSSSFVLPAEFLIGFAIITIVYFILFSVRCDYDYEYEFESVDDDDYYGLSPVSYLLKVFNVGLISGAATIFIGLTSQGGRFDPSFTSFFFFIDILVSLICIGYSIYLLGQRALNANLSFRYLLFYFLLLVIVLIAYVFIPLNIIMLLLQVTLFLQFILIVLPTKRLDI